MKELEDHYGDKVRVEYHHYPLSFHNYAESSAVASVAAQKQGGTRIKTVLVLPTKLVLKTVVY